ncbi:uncharacterized protein LOC110674107 [Aedes aegypti]|uniref:Uncharacterized protein n=1 Tax=Aedes aegypti TaxID=7159 RepID=A0A6I8U1C5_AEDAE|nr:uncharacterized protein LOC110674107 [Aedes aegypti]
MNPLTKFERPMYSKLVKHPGVWQPNLYRSRPIKTAMESSDPHLLDGYAFRNLYLESATMELPAQNHSGAERYEDFVSRIADINQGTYGCVHREHFAGKKLGVEFLKRNWLDQGNTTYRREHCEGERVLDSLEVKRKKIRARKQSVPIPPGWTFKDTSSAAAHRGWEELSQLVQTANTIQ